MIAGKTLFKANCSGCHTLKAAGTVAKRATRGLNFDTKRETFTKVFQVLAQGSGDMPPFTDKLSFKQLRDIAAFVAVSTKSNPASSY